MLSHATLLHIGGECITLPKAAGGALRIGRHKRSAARGPLSPWTQSTEERTFSKVLLQVQNAPVLPQLLLGAPELHRRQHIHAQLVAGCLPLIRVCLQPSTSQCKSAPWRCLGPFRSVLYHLPALSWAAPSGRHSCNAQFASAACCTLKQLSWHDKQAEAKGPHATLLGIRSACETRC